MKTAKLLPLALFLFLPLLLASCVDYVQSICYKDGKYQMYYKISFSKALLQLGGEDPEELLKEYDGTGMDWLPKGAAVKTVDTDLEVGVEYSFAISPRTKDGAEKALLPKVAAGRCYIPFLFGLEEFGGELDPSDLMNSGSEEDDAIVRAMLSSAKCRILLDKNAFPNLEAAFFRGNGGQDYSIPLFDYGDSFCLEIPFVLLAERDSYRLDQVVVVQGI